MLLLGIMSEQACYKEFKMTVKELIEELQQCPQNAEIIVGVGNGVFWIDEIKGPLLGAYVIETEKVPDD